MRSFSKYTHDAIAVAVLALMLLAFMPAGVAAQTRKVMNRPYIDQRRFHYGFLAGVHMQDLELNLNDYTDEEGNHWLAEQPNYEPGFSVGILGEMYLTKHIALRAIPTMHFGTKNLTFRNELNREKEYQNMKSTYISIPIDVKVTAERFNNYRPYVMAGINPMIDLTIKKQQQLLLKRFDLYLECGLGCDFYLPFFKLIPELKFCWGLFDMIDKDRSDLTDERLHIFTRSVKSGFSKMIVLTLYFE